MQTELPKISHVPFSLCCMHCDAGMDVDSFEQAVLLGWEDIEFDDGLGWNFLGWCPECRSVRDR